MAVLRTPDERFVDLFEWSFEPHYASTKDGLRVHYVDEGPRDGRVVLLMHGEPTWSYLYRKMIAPLAASGMRVIAPDLIGFGRSDKLDARADYTYQRHVDWMANVLEGLDLQEITLFCQDWGGLIGLRLVAELGERFARVVASNTFLPTGDTKLPDAFFEWQKFSQTVPALPIAQIIAKGCARPIDEGALRAYEAPFPEERYKEGARQFPLLVPSRPDDPASAANRSAWEVLGRWDKPWLTLFSDKDPITAGADKLLHALIPGTMGQDHRTIRGAGHFIQEDAGPELADEITRFMG